jgi:anti-sigma regulatory factor (Ser/Thr protein kinase)
MKEISVPAVCEQLDMVTSFVGEDLDLYGCNFETKAMVFVAIEEIFVNIARYAYRPEIGCVWIRHSISAKPLQITIQFVDDGKPFNPLEKENPDITLNADERGIGGLGIFIVKSQMDYVDYEYKDGRNILTLRKNLE